MSTRIRWISIAVVGLLLVFAGLLRLIGLNDNPPGFWQDEASTGLDAYLIWTTGHDRAGQFLPIISRSFGDYPLALYRYLDAPIVGLFGTSPKNERLVAAISGFLMVPTVGLFVFKTLGSRIAVATMLSAALAPTWIHFSRYGSEAMLLPFCLIAGATLVEFGRTRRWAIWLGFASIGMSAYTYHAVKLILPVWMIAFLIYQAPFIKELWKNEKRHVLGPALLFTVLVLPSVVMATTAEGMSRGTAVMAWNRFDRHEVVGRMLHHYLSYFDPSYLFVVGGPAAAQSIPGLGLWSLIELPLMLAGAWTMVRDSENRRVYLFIVAWFVIGPLPGGLSYEAHNVGRAIAWLPAPQIISGIGCASLVAFGLSAKWPRRAVLIALAVAWFVTAQDTTRKVFVDYPQKTPRNWQFEISRAMRCARQHRRSNERILISRHFHYARTFGRFFFADLDGTKIGKLPALEFADRTVVGPQELYIVPADRPRPKGKVICQIRENEHSPPRSFVFADPTRTDTSTPTK